MTAREHRPAHLVARRGLPTNSPPQFGHTLAISSAQVEQNVHSYEQILASLSQVNAVPQRSQSVRISNAIGKQYLAQPARLTLLTGDAVHGPGQSAE